MERLARLAAAHGVSTSYEPAPGTTVDISHESIIAVLAALGIDASTPRAVREALEAHAEHSRRLLPPTVVLRTRSAADPVAAGVCRALPEGTVLRVDTEAGKTLDWSPGAALPLGVHTLRARTPDGRTSHATLVAAPERAPQSPEMPGPAAGHRSVGLLTLPHALLTRHSWGMGDLGDLADLADWSGRALGAGFIQLGPLHAAVPGPPTDPSPYRPSSRRFPDPVYLRVTAVPEFARLEGAARRRADEYLTRAATLREAVLDNGALIDRDAVWELKQRALEELWKVPLSPDRRAAHRAFLAEQGQALDDHATWRTLAELHGPDWREWPSGLDDPRSSHTARARAAHTDRVDFHRWLAWLTDTQVAHAQHTARVAGMPIGFVHDLAIGVHPHGADTWARQDAFAHGMSVGAPPDAFNAQGQDWGLPPWRPDILAACGYAPYRDVLRGVLRHAGALRTDHVMGNFRLWWVPEGRPPTEGAYVHYDADAMLGVLALEAHRARAAVIGEDLGTVEPVVRRELADRGMLGTSVLWFERDWANGPEDITDADRSGTDTTQEAAGTRTGTPTGTHTRTRTHAFPEPLAPRAWRADCLATATTHDLPPTAARLHGDHVTRRHRLGLLARPLPAERTADAAETESWLSYFQELGLLPEGGGEEESKVKAVYRFLARTPARMLGVWLPDAVGDRRPQNVPGTCDEYPNWRLPIADGAGRPVSLEELAASGRVYSLFNELRRYPAESEDGQSGSEVTSGKRTHS